MRAPVRRAAIVALFVGYMGAMLYVAVFLPLPVRLDDTRFVWASVNLVPARTVRRFATTAAVGLSVSVGIELVQLALLLTLISRRSVNVDDVIST